MVAEQNGETVGMAITIPDINQALKKMQGRLLPWRPQAKPPGCRREFPWSVLLLAWLPP